MNDRPLEEKIDELLSIVKAMDIKLNWIQDDLAGLKQDVENLPKIQACVEQLAATDLMRVQEREKAKYKVERL
jgi:hypothetical protein